MSRVAAAEVAGPSSRTIGEILLSRRLITHALLEEAVAAQQTTGKPLGQILVETGAITRLELASALAEQWGDAGTISPTFPGGSEYIEPVGSSDTATHLAEIRRERRALEARMGELDRGSDAEATVEITTVVQGLGARIEAIETRLTGLEEPDGSTSHDELYDVVARLASRLEDVEPQLTGLHDAVAGSASAIALEQGLGEIAAAVDGVAPRIAHAEESAGALESRMDELSALVAQALTQLRQSAADSAAAQAELAQRVADVPGRSAHEALEAAVESLRETVSELVRRPAGDPELAARVGDLARVVEGLAARPEVDPTLAVRIDELAERLDLGAGAVPSGGEPDARVDALIARVAELAARPAGDPGLDERLAALSGRLEELAARPSGDEDLRAQLAALAARLETIDAREVDRVLEERLDGVVARLDALATAPATDAELRAGLDVLAARLDEVSARPAGGPELEEKLVEAIGRIEELSARPQIDPAVEERLAALAERLEVLDRSASEAAATDGVASAQVEALGARLAELESRPPADIVLARLAELEAAVQTVREARGAPSAEQVDEALAQRLRVIDEAAQSLTQELSRATAAWADDRRDLEARLEWLAARVEAEVSTAAQVAAAPVPQSPGRRVDGEVTNVSGADVEKLRMAVERLMLDFADHRRAFSAALPGRDLEERVRLLTEQVADLQVAGPVTNGSGPAAGGGERSFAGEARALTHRLDEVEAATVAARDTMLARLERMMGTIDWRLQRLEKPESP